MGFLTPYMLWGALAVGIPLAMLVGRALTSSLYGVQPMDTISYLLAVVGLEREEGIGGAEGTVAKIVKRGAMYVVGAGLGDDVDHGTGGASLLGAVGIGGDAKLLHDFGGELVGGAIASAGLGEESVVVVQAVDQGGVLEPTNAAEGEIAVGGRGKAARILRDAGGEQGEIGEAAAVQRKVVDGTFVEEGGDGTGLGFNQGGGGGDGDLLLRSRDGEMEYKEGGSADIDMQLGRDLGRHVQGCDASEVIAGRKQLEGERSGRSAGRSVARSGRSAD